MATSKPVLIFIPGAWHTPEYFSEVIEKLESYAYECHALRLPSVGGDDTTTVANDAAFIRKTTLPIIEAGKKVVLVMHSYGGVPGTESVKGGLAQKDREAIGKNGGVVGLVYLASFLIPEQGSINTFLGSMPDWITHQANRLFLTRTLEIMYNDIPIKIGKKYAQMTQYQAASSFATPLTYPAYRHVATTYLLCKQDRAIPLELQRAMVKLVGEDASTYLCDSGHSPMIKMPESVVNVIRKAAGETMCLTIHMPNEPHIPVG